jgi:hypothetical protein
VERGAGGRMCGEGQGLRARACMHTHTHTTASESERARAREHKKYSQPVVTNICVFVCVTSHAGQRGMPGGRR